MTVCRRENQEAGETVQSTTSGAQEVPFSSVTTVVVCAEGPTLSDRVAERFGRAACFQLVDPRTMTSEVIPNDENRAGTQGAGIGAVELLAERQPQAAIVATVGPKAADAFRRAAIPVYEAREMTVVEAVAAFVRGELPRIDHG